MTPKGRRRQWESLSSAVGVATALALGAALGCGSDSSVKKDAAPPPPKPVDASTAPAGPIDHPATVDGLKAQLDALISAQSLASEAGGSQAVAASHALVLPLPKPEEWFRDRFGGKRGRRLWTAYKPIAENPGDIVGLITKLNADGLGVLDVRKFEKVDDLDAVGYQSAALKAMRITTPLYSVRFLSKARDGSAPDPKTKVFHLWSFVHDSGRFRFVGKIRGIAKSDNVGGRDLLDYRPIDAERLRQAATAAPK